MNMKTPTLTGIALLVAAMMAMPAGSAALLEGADHNQTCLVDDGDLDALYNNAVGSAGITPGNNVRLCLWAILDWFTPGANFVDMEGVFFSDPMGVTPVAVVETAQILGDGLAGARTVGSGGQVRAYQDGNDAGSVDGTEEGLCFLSFDPDGPGALTDPCAAATITACNVQPAVDPDPTVSGEPGETPETPIAGDFCLRGTVGASVGGWLTDLPPECLLYDSAVAPWFIGQFIQLLYPSAISQVNQVVKTSAAWDTAADSCSGDPTASGSAGQTTVAGVGAFQVDTLAGLRDVVTY